MSATIILTTVMRTLPASTRPDRSAALATVVSKVMALQSARISMSALPGRWQLI